MLVVSMVYCICWKDTMTDVLTNTPTSYRVRVHNDIFGEHWSAYYPSCIGFLLNLGIFLSLSHFPTRSYGVRVVCSLCFAGLFIPILFITCAKVTNLSTFPRETIPP